MIVPVVGLVAVAPLAVLAVGIILELAFARLLSRPAKGWLAFAVDLAAAGATLGLVPSIGKGAIDLPLFSWDQQIALSLHIDAVSLIFAIMATGIGCAILLYSVQYMADEEEGVTRFFILMLAFIAGLVLLVFTDNLLVLYFSWELIGLCSYFLVGFWYREEAAVNGARKVLVMTHVAGYGLLAAIILIFVRSGTFTWTNPAVSGAFTTGVFLLMLLAAVAKSVQFPLHTWIPEAMNAPTPVSALLHSACYVKAGVYLIARMYSLGAWQTSWHTLVIIIGCITMTAGILFALVQTDVKRMLAFSTVSQLGYIVTALGLGTSLGLTAALFYTISHGLFKGTLFLCAGAVQKQTGTRDMHQLGGLSAYMPFTTTVWLVAAAAISGVPLLNGFVAKWLVLDAALVTGNNIVVFVAWFISIFTALTFLRATATIFFGSTPENLIHKKIIEVPVTMKAGMGILGSMLVIFGVAPQIIIQTLVSPAVEHLGFNLVEQISWLGVRTDSAGVQITLGAVIVLAAFIAGLLLYFLSRAPHPGKAQVVAVFAGGDPAPEENGMVSAADFISLAESSIEPVYRVIDPDPAYLSAWGWLRSASERLTSWVVPTLESHPVWAVAAAAILILIAVFAI